MSKNQEIDQITIFGHFSSFKAMVGNHLPSHLAKKLKDAYVIKIAKVSINVKKQNKPDSLKSGKGAQNGICEIWCFQLTSSFRSRKVATFLVKSVNLTGKSGKVLKTPYFTSTQKEFEIKSKNLKLQV